MIKKLAFAAAVATAVYAAPASAAIVITNSDPANCTTGTPVCVFDIDGEVTTSGLFTLVSNIFTLPQLGSVTSQVGNSASLNLSPNTNIDISSAFLTNTSDSTVYNFIPLNVGSFSNAFLEAAVTGGAFRLTVNGTATTSQGNANPLLNGDLTFVAAVVPEPATWALFILGFGAIGGALRRRSGAVRVSKAKLNFA